MVDGADGGEDYVSNVHYDDGINSHCSTDGLDDKFVMNANVDESNVSVCNKRNGDWDKCLERAKTGRQPVVAIE